MKLGIMQPYFFPYLGYFDLIHSVDKWVVFDTPQYIRHGWVNRNRILHPESDWQYIIVPLKKHPRNTPIKEIEIADGIEDADLEGVFLPTSEWNYVALVRATSFDKIMEIYKAYLKKYGPHPKIPVAKLELLLTLEEVGYPT